MTAQSPYQILGEEGIGELVDAFYDAMEELPDAARIRAMHKTDLSEVRGKLKDYLTGWMGGPPLYHRKTGTVCLTDPHEPYAIGPRERDQWLLCMERALEEVVEAQFANCPNPALSSCRARRMGGSETLSYFVWAWQDRGNCEAYTRSIIHEIFFVNLVSCN